MSATWTGKGSSVLLDLDRTDGTPVGHQLQDQLRGAVRDGRLRAGERLPSSRRLSEELRVSRGMVVACLRAAHLRGLPGRGGRLGHAGGRWSERCGPPVTTCGNHPPVHDHGATGRRRLRVRRARPAARRHCATGCGPCARPDAPRRPPVMGDETDAGDLHLREVLAAYHRRVRAGSADAEHAVIVNGFRQGLVLSLGALARSGVERVGLEDPGPR